MRQQMRTDAYCKQKFFPVISQILARNYVNSIWSTKSATINKFYRSFSHILSGYIIDLLIHHIFKDFFLFLCKWLKILFVCDKHTNIHSPWTRLSAFRLFCWNLSFQAVLYYINNTQLPYNWPVLMEVSEELTLY